MEALYSALLKNTAWLYTILYRNDVLFIDLWTFPHLWSGAVLMVILLQRSVRRPVAWLVCLLLLYELAELALLILSVRVFEPEVLLDKGTDVIVGGVGGGLAWGGLLMLRRASGSPRGRAGRLLLTAIFSSVSLSFVWVGSYGYTYNVESFNSPGLNWWAFSLWTWALTTTVLVNAMVKRYFPARYVRLTGIWGAYCVGLVILEYTGYHVFGIREVQGLHSPPLVFGLMHGSPLMKLYYGVAGLAAIGLQELAARGIAAAAASPRLLRDAPLPGPVLSGQAESPVT